MMLTTWGAHHLVNSCKFKAAKLKAVALPEGLALCLVVVLRQAWQVRVDEARAVDLWHVNARGVTRDTWRQQLV